jgi:A/G-specific adenine glycosylase
MMHGGETMLERRGNGDIWRSLYQFPVVESAFPLDEEELLGPRLKEMLKGVPMQKVTVRKISGPIKHQLTHRTLYARFIHLETGAWPKPLPKGWIPVLADEVDDYPVPRLINRYMEVVNFSYL